MANIYKRGQTWWGRVQRGGKEIRASLETRSESVARERLRAWVNRLEAEDWGDRPKITVNEAADTFILEHCPTLRLSSRKRYGRSIAYLDERLGDKMLADVRSADLKDFETWRRSMGAAAPTVRRDLACLSSIYGFAAEKEWVDTNPVSAFLKARKKRGLRESPPRTRYLTRDEEARLLEAAAPRLRAAIVFAIYSGLRSEEQWGLTWDRVDLERRQVEIPKEIAKAKRDRTAILLDPAVAVLRSLPRHIKEPFVFFHGGRAPSRAVKRDRAPLKDGQRFGHMLRGLKAAAKRAGIPNLIWHDLRRTHGCRLLQEQGWSMEMVRDQLGHSTSVQTERSYAFLEVDARRQMAARTIPGTAENPPTAGAAGTTDGTTPAQKPAHRAVDKRR
ncbi:site-specific integrase [Xanthobacter tagetidis]|uniref:Site-specific integrase n=1 Tax=Xanthobacter tagetidis TaxID=60216 RepID=A0A3L7AIZ6_9HYPH|nr:site-specific integrase [Xanthobacter tagetidis]